MLQMLVADFLVNSYFILIILLSLVVVPADSVNGGRNVSLSGERLPPPSAQSQDTPHVSNSLYDFLIQYSCTFNRIKVINYYAICN